MKAPGWAPPLAAGTIRGKSQANTPRATLDVFVCDFPLIAQPGKAGLPTRRF